MYQQLLQQDITLEAPNTPQPAPEAAAPNPAICAPQDFKRSAPGLVKGWEKVLGCSHEAAVMGCSPEAPPPRLLNPNPDPGAPIPIPS